VDQFALGGLERGAGCAQILFELANLLGIAQRDLEAIGGLLSRRREAGRGV
jgi:hypothetical protein